MMRALCVCFLMFFTDFATAQTDIQTEKADGAVLRVLDTLTGEVEDLEIFEGEEIKIRRLHVYLQECRYPADNIVGNAFSYLIIRDERDEKPKFEGWMIASSPALSALEHPRYDVWVLKCTTLEG